MRVAMQGGPAAASPQRPTDVQAPTARTSLSLPLYMAPRRGGMWSLRANSTRAAATQAHCRQSGGAICMQGLGAVTVSGGGQRRRGGLPPLPPAGRREGAAAGATCMPTRCSLWRATCWLARACRKQWRTVLQAWAITHAPCNLLDSSGAHRPGFCCLREGQGPLGAAAQSGGGGHTGVRPPRLIG